MYVIMSLGWHQRCMWRIASYEVIIVLCTKHSHQSTVDNIWQRLTCYCEIILSSEVREKLQRELHLFLEIFEFRICLINIPQLLGALSPRPEALDPVEAPPQTLCIGSKSRASYKTYHPELSKYLFAHIERTCSNRNKLRNKSTSSEILHMKRLAVWNDLQGCSCHYNCCYYIGHVQVSLPISGLLLHRFWDIITFPLYETAYDLEKLPLVPTSGMTLFDFCRDLWHPKAKVLGLLCGTVCIILHLTFMIQYWRMTDRQMDVTQWQLMPR